MYPVVPITKEVTYFTSKLNILKLDSKKILDNLEILKKNNYSDEIVVDVENINDYVEFTIKCTNRKCLEVFFFKISSIANDSYLRRIKKPFY